MNIPQALADLLNKTDEGFIGVRVFASDAHLSCVR